MHRKRNICDLKFTLFVFLLFLGLTSCRDSSQAEEGVFSYSNLLPAGIESRCEDPTGDANYVSDNAWDYVLGNADFRAALVGTGEFSADSNDLILLVAIEMTNRTNPIYDALLAGFSDDVKQSVMITISAATEPGHTIRYDIGFEQTTTQNQPLVTVSRFDSSASDADMYIDVYEVAGKFEDGLFSAGIPVTIFKGIAKGSTWVAFSFSSLSVSGTFSMARDKCGGGIL